MPRRRNTNINHIDENDISYVLTPIGHGTIVSNRFQFDKAVIVDKKITYEQEIGYLVNIPITEEIAKHLGDSNCVTKYAKVTGMWYFTNEVMEKLNSKLVVTNKE